MVETSEDKSPAVSLLQALPAELISEIFLACERSGRLSRREAPLSLTQISRDLRCIVVTTPALWTKLSFELGDLPAAGGLSRADSSRLLLKSRISTIQECIDRSAPLPLSIFCEESWNNIANITRYPVEFREMVQIIANVSTRLRHLSLQCVLHPTGYQPLFDLSANDTPMLYSINISWSGQSHPLGSSNILGAPSLRKLSLKGYDNRCLQNPRVCWANLIDLDLGASVVPRNLVLHTQAYVLLQTKNLNCLSTNSGEPGNDTIDQIFLSHLKFLGVIAAIPGSSTTSILKYLHTPALETLKIHNDFSHCEGLLRSSLLLRDLKVHISYHDAYMLSLWVPYCPQISSLSISWKTARSNLVAENILEIFLKQQGGSFLLGPNLCNFRCSHTIRTSFDTLSRFLGGGTSSSPPRRLWRRIHMSVQLTYWSTATKQALHTLTAEMMDAAIDLQLNVVNTP